MLFVALHRRQEDATVAPGELPRCFTSAFAECVQPVMAEFGDDPLAKLRHTDVREVCGYGTRCLTVRVHHSEGSTLLKAVFHGRCREQFLILPQPDDGP